MWSPVSAGAQFVSFGSKMFDALLRRKKLQLAEAFIESHDLLVQFDNQKRFCFGHAYYYISDTLWCELKALIYCVCNLSDLEPLQLERNGADR